METLRTTRGQRFPVTARRPGGKAVTLIATPRRAERLDRTDKAARLAAGLVIAVAQLADVALTQHLLAHGAIEANPVARALIRTGTLGIAKLALAIAITGLAVRARPSRLLDSALWFVAGIYVTVVGLTLLYLVG